MKLITEESGFGLVEVIMSVVLLALIMIGLTGIYTGVIQSNISRNNRRVAITLVQEKIEEFNSLAFNLVESDLISSPTGVDETVTNASDLNDYPDVQRVSAWNYVDDADFTAVSATATNSVMITVTVSPTGAQTVTRYVPVSLQAVRTRWE